MMPSDHKPKVTIDLNLWPDLKTTEVNIMADGEKVAGVNLLAEQVDALIGGLAGIRSKMIPETPHQFPQGKPTHNHQASNYYFGLEPFSGTPFLSFRSPGFGWLTFALPDGEIEKIHSSLPKLKTLRAAPRSDKTH